MKAIVNLKGSGSNIWEVFEVLDDVRRAIFRDTVFGYFIDVPRLQGDALLFHKIFAWGSYLWDFTYVDIKDTWNKIDNYLSLSERRQTLKYSVSGFTAPISIWIYEMIPAVRACGLVLRKNKDMPRMKRWSGTKKLKMVDVNKIFSKLQEGQPPRQNMLPSDGEMTSCYYMLFQEYVYGEGKAVPSPVRENLRRQDEYSSSMSSGGHSHGRGRGSRKHNLDEVLKRLHALEQHVFMSRQPTEVFVEEVNTEQFWNDITFDGPIVSQRKYDEQVVQDEVMNKNNTTDNVFGDIQDDKVLEEKNDYAGNKFDDDVLDVNDYSEVKKESEERNDNAGNKFDDDVFDLNDYNEAKEVSDEDEIIITGIVDYFDEYDGKEVTPDKPTTRKPSQYLCPPYTELHTTPKQKRRAKKKVDIKSTSPVPPPVFGVAHDFSMLCLQPYVAGGEVVIQNYLFHSYDVQHFLFNFVLDRDFWSSLFGHTHDGWLELSDWRAFMAGIATYPNFMVAWWDVDTVLLPIHSSLNHWLFGELRLASMEVHIYDSLGRGAYEKFKSEGIFSKFERRVANYLDKIKYWARRNIPRIPLNMQFIYEENVPQQSSHLGDCGVFVCMFMEQFVSGQPIRVLIDPKNASLEFRQRMTKIYWGSSLGPM
uniref:Ubiquitin-like protease family profile domain-containing protein n=1 Tax=Lactuca sativa TaxID=4236 RepID=A0A9R1W3T1_LACSA|nr:hypothetical protein LSAT_V11C300127150 [Lactuca sativa]